MTRKSAADHGVSASTVVMLQSMTSYPSVSLLMPTAPGRLDADQRRRLAALRGSAADRLAAEQRSDSDRSFSTRRVLDELDELVDQAAEVPLDQALALYANEHHAQLLVLPVSVRERVVVDPTFATRDLVRALHRTPRHVVLILSGREARLLEGQLGSLGPAQTSKFPMRVDRDVQGRDERRDAFLGRVDRALEAYLASRQDEALALLEQRRGQDRAVLGLDSVWLAARWERPEMLAVEVDFFYPARISLDGDSLEPADDVEHPDVIDDVVDELVEQVLARGAWVALMEPGHVPEGQRVALTMRRH